MKVVKMKTQHHKTLRIAAALALTGMLSGQAFALPAVSNNATADVTVRLVQPISIQKVSDLNFGALLTGGVATIAVLPSGTVQTEGRELPSLGSQPTPAVFEVAGEPFLNYSLSTNSLVALLTNENSDTLGVTLLVDIASGDNVSGTLSDSGQDLVRVGGFFLMSDQARGNYTAPDAINLTVNYN